MPRLPAPLHRLAARARAAVASLGRGPAALVAVAALVVAIMYGCNQDMGGKPDAPRGTGEYLPVLARGDGHLMFLMARSIAFDGDLQFDNDLARFGDPFAPAGGRTERATIPHPLGPPLVWVPLLWAAQGVAALADLAGADIELHGYTLWHQRIVFSTSVIAALLAIGLGLALARRVVGGRWGPAYAAVAILLGTAVTYYATFMPSYSHALDAAGAAGFLYAWATTLGRWDRRRVIVLGVLLGVAALMRTQELALGIVVAFEAALALVRPPPGASRVRVMIAAPLVAVLALVVLIPQALVWHDQFGGWLSLPQGATFTRPRYPQIAELLFASRNGWLSTHPLAYAGVLGLVALVWRGPRIAPQARVIGGGLLLALALQVYLNAIILDWWAQASFGQRRLCSMTLPLVVGLATWLHLGAALLRRWRAHLGWGHALTVIVLGWFVWWNLAIVWSLRGGRPAQYGAAPAYHLVRSPLHDLARPVYAAIGNPFALPASAVFAWRHDVEIQRWDRVIGNYPWLPGLDYTRASLRGQSATWPLGDPSTDVYVVRGATTGGTARADLRWTTARRAVLLVPNLVPEPMTLTLRLVPNLGPGLTTQAIVVRWNGRVVVDRTIAETTDVEWPIAGDVGTNELVVEAAIAPPGTVAALTGVDAVGVGLGPLRFTGR